MPTMGARLFDAVLCDLDGVLRRWDPAPMIAVEVKYGLKPASLLETSMSWDIYRPAMAGEISDEEWMGLVASRLPLDEAEAAAAAIRETRGQAEAEYRHTLSDDLAKAEQKASGLTQDLIKA